MSGSNKILADTNLIILAIDGNQKARRFLDGNTLFISIITEIELLSISFSNPQDEKLMIDFISHCYVIALDSEVKRQIRFCAVLNKRLLLYEAGVFKLCRKKQIK